MADNIQDGGGDATHAVSRRAFLSTGAAGIGTAALAAAASEAAAQAGPRANVPIRWDRSADVVVIGAGVAGLPAAITARDLGASVIIVDENYDIGGRGILSGGRVHLGGGHALQQKAGIKDSADQVSLDWVRFDTADARYSDRDMVRVFADENVATFNFLVENGVKFIEKPIGPERASTVPRTFVTVEWPIASELIAPGRGRNGSGLVRQLAIAARQKGAEILLQHEMKSIVRDGAASGRVLGITAAHHRHDGQHRGAQGRHHRHRRPYRQCRISAASSIRGSTEEYQQACEPYVHQGADGELAAMAIGGSLWATANQTSESGSAITKTRHIGCRWGYASLVFQPESPMFHLAKATGLTVEDWQNVIFVNQFGRRFWNEADGSYKFFAAAMALQRRSDQAQRRRSRLGDLRRRRGGAGEMGPEAAPCRSRRLFLRRRHRRGACRQDRQSASEPGRCRARCCRQTVDRYNGFVAAGVDRDFKKPTPMYKIEKPPFYAAWSTPILHDTLTGLRTTRNAEVVDHPRRTSSRASIAPASRRADSPSMGSRGAWCSAASPAATLPNAPHEG